MSDKNLRQLFELAAELYRQELKKSGMSTLPFCWAENEKTGEFIVYSAFGVDSKELKTKLDLAWVKRRDI